MMKRGGTNKRIEQDNGKAANTSVKLTWFKLFYITIKNRIGMAPGSGVAVGIYIHSPGIKKYAGSVR